MVVHIKRKLKARIRHQDGTDSGCLALLPGFYGARHTADGALEIIQDNAVSAYVLPFILWEKLNCGELLIQNEATA
jgi:hypothetical protein